MHVVIFEGMHWRTFAPLSLSRPVFMLGTGMGTLLEKQLRHTQPTRLTLWVRPELADLTRKRIIPRLKIPTRVNEPLDDEPALLVSGRTLHLRRHEGPDGHYAVIDEGGLVRQAYVKSPGLTPDDALYRSDRWVSMLDLPRQEPKTRLVERLWDLIKWNEESLIEDFTQIRRADYKRPDGPFHVIDDENLWASPEAQLQPGCVLDCSRGPVIIDRNAVIGANAVIQGPCFIGAYASVAPLSYIRPGTSIGMMSKVGGEVSNSILFGYTNKSHEGFMGDSYVGKWVNLGAGTTTSNLKNTYGEITVPGPSGPVKTGRRFLGAVIGDHVKTAVGTRLMAGTYLGFSSMLACSAFAPRLVPSYTFQTDRGAEPYRLNKAIDVMKSVFARRERGWDEIDDQVTRYVSQAAPEVEAMASEPR